MRFAKTKITVAFAVLSVLCGAGAAQQQDLDSKIDSKEGELETLRKQIEDQRKKIKDLEKQEKNVTEYLKKLRDEEALVRRLLDGLDEKKEMLEEQSLELRRQLGENETEYARRQGVLKARLREIYKDGPRGTWKELLSARDVPDLFQRYKFISMVTERDAELVRDVRQRKEDVEMQDAELTEVLQEVTASLAEKAKELRKLEENAAKRKKTLQGLKADRKKYEERVEELAAAERRLQTLIDELEKARLEQSKAWGDYGEADFASLKGKMQMPVSGKTVRRFGQFRHPEYGTVTYNTGIDIEARTGEPVRAVARGRVEYAGNLPGYGSCIILNHGGGYYTLYAHISELFVSQGSQVEKGKLIAEAGRDASGAEGTLHFEIRQSKKAVDPSEWLTGGSR